MSSDKKPPIIKKIIKKGHGGHHGGSWKVAYADFVTAMMAFFLVMWLLAISSEQGKAALSDYFENLTMSEAMFNGGMPSAFDPSNPSPGILSGGCYDLKEMGKELEDKQKKLDEREKALENRQDGRPNLAAAIPTDREQPPDVTELPEGQEGGEGSDQKGVAPGSGPAPTEITPGMGTGTAEEGQKAKTKLANDLKEDVSNALGGNADGQFSVEIVPGGLKLQLMDREGRPLFVSGQPRLTPAAQAILTTIAERLNQIPNKIAIEGHTDAVATSSQEMTNWELSTARAASSRRFLARMGVNDNRLTMVAGYASTQPLPNTNPLDPINRRIAIMIWDAQPPAASPSPQSPKTSPQNDNSTEGETAPPLAPAAGAQNLPSPIGRRPAPRPSPTKVSPENMEQMLLDLTLKNAAAPDTSTAGPPPAPTAPEE